MGNEWDFAIGKLETEDKPRISNWMIQCHAFSHLALPVGDLFLKIPREAQTRFKPLVDAYGVALRDYSSDSNDLFVKYSALFDSVYEFNFGDQFQHVFIDPHLTNFKIKFFHDTTAARADHGSFIIHPENNAWMIITYILRHVVTNFERDIVCPFKMIPLFDVERAKEMKGWIQIPVPTQFLYSTFESDFEETAATVVAEGIGGFTAMNGFESHTQYPILFRYTEKSPRSGALYIKSDINIFYD
jgi:hypothetical protein